MEAAGLDEEEALAYLQRAKGQPQRPIRYRAPEGAPDTYEWEVKGKMPDDPSYYVNDVKVPACKAAAEGKGMKEIIAECEDPAAALPLGGDDESKASSCAEVLRRAKRAVCSSCEP